MKQTLSIGSFQYEFSEQELIEASSSVYHGIRDIRNSVLMNPVRSIFLVMGQQPQARRGKASLNCIFSSSTEDLTNPSQPIPKGTVQRIFYPTLKNSYC